MYGIHSHILVAALGEEEMGESGGGVQRRELYQEFGRETGWIWRYMVNAVLLFLSGSCLGEETAAASCSACLVLSSSTGKWLDQDMYR